MVPGRRVSRSGREDVSREGRCLWAPGRWPLVTGGSSTRLNHPWQQPPSAVLVECLDEVLSDVLRRSTLDLPTLEHEHQLAILEQSNRRRRRRIAGEVLPRALRRVDVLAG